jgi:hypothetical protein
MESKTPKGKVKEYLKFVESETQRERERELLLLSFGGSLGLRERERERDWACGGLLGRERERGQRESKV